MGDFNRCIQIILAEEGGWVNHPRDPGKLTKYGISQRSYPEINIAHLTREQAEAIYRRDYWNPIKGDDLPAFAANAEPLLCTPTFQTPGSPVSLYLCRDDAGTFKKVLDETVFNSASPGRPTPKNDSSQHLFYTATDLGGGIKTYAVKAPADPVCIVKDAGKDPITGADLPGNTILFRWTGVVPTLLEVEADIEDITDPAGYFPVGLSNITTYAESSVGLSLLKADSQIVPQDGLGHVVNFRLRYNVNGDVGAWVPINNTYIQFDLAAPNPPTSLTATLLRDRVDTVPDVVKLDWGKDEVSPGTGVEIYATDYLGKKHSIYTSNGPELTCRVDNISRFVVQDTGLAVARPYVFSIVATNISTKSSEKTAAAPLNITSKVKASSRRPGSPEIAPWRKEGAHHHSAQGERFVAAESDAFIEQVMAVARQTPQHTYQILTKRTERLAAFFAARSVPPNVWLGVSVENRQHGLPRIDHLRQIPARVPASYRWNPCWRTWGRWT